MSKYRIYEVAKALHISNKELQNKLTKMNIEYKSHMSSLSEEDYDKVMKAYHQSDNTSNKQETKKVDTSNKSTDTGNQNNRPNNNRSNNNNNNSNNSNRSNNNNSNNSNRSNNNNNNSNRSNDNNNRPNNNNNNNRSNNSNNNNNRSNNNNNNNNNRSNNSNNNNNRSNNSNNNNNNRSNNSNNNNNNRSNNNNNNRPNNNKPNNNNNRSNNKNNGPQKNTNHSDKSIIKTQKNVKKSSKRYKKKPYNEQPVVEVVMEDEIGVIEIADTIMVKELAEKLRIQTSDIIKKLFMKGIMVSATQEIGFDQAVEIAEEYDVLVEKLEEVDILDEFFKEEEDFEEELESRPPVVVVMGHVDHGKTSLLDAIRSSNVTDKEHGGITQHIGASRISINDQTITFLDTPGHEAFTSMRLRGAMATDIAILVVAADDGVMPQTIEAINHAKAAGVQIIIAINKIDKPGANPERVKQELVEYGLVAEDWGGETICVPVSAIERTNLDQLLEMVILVSEMSELRANPNKKARGTIIEAQLDKGRGPVATVLVQEGTLKVGDSIVAGPAHGRIRAMYDDRGKKVKQAGPSVPVEILGLSEVPTAGDAFYTAKNDREARHVAEKVNDQIREKLLQYTPNRVTLDDIFSQIKAGEMKELNIIIKADVQGSVEAVKQSLVKLSNEEVMISVIHGGVGAINESDVMLASASNAIIIGFNVRPEAAAKISAEKEQIDLRLYRVIYNAIEDIEAAMKGMLDPIFKEKVIGSVEVRQIYTVSGVGTVAGCYVKEGKIIRNAQVRLLRDNIVVYEGELASLKRFKDDVKEVNTNYECGLMLEKYNDLKEGDIVEAFIMEEIPR